MRSFEFGAWVQMLGRASAKDASSAWLAVREACPQEALSEVKGKLGR